MGRVVGNGTWYSSIGTQCIDEFLVVVSIVKSAYEFVHTSVVNLLLLLLAFDAVVILVLFIIIVVTLLLVALIFPVNVRY